MFVLTPAPDTKQVDIGMTHPRGTSGRTSPMSLGRALSILLCPMLAVAAAVGCRVQQPPNQHEREQILYQSTISDPRTFNPILVTDSASGEVVGDLFEGLVRINPITTLPEPGLAESWELSDGRQVDHFPSAPRGEMVRRSAIHGARRRLYDARDL